MRARMTQDPPVDWRQLIYAIFQEFEYRRTSLRTIPQVEPGSDLDDDCRSSPLAPTDQAAWLGLSMAGDHVYALHRLWLADRKRFHSEACFSLIRPALVGASKAFWVLQPDESAERTLRALLLARSDLDQMRKAMSTTLETTGPALEPRRVAEFEAAIQRIRENVDSLGAGIDKRNEKSRGMPGETALIKSAASIIGDDPLSKSAPETLWRMMSGTSHGMLWQRFGRGHSIAREGDEYVLYSEVDVSEYGAALGVTYRAWKRGWELFERRRRPSGAGSSFFPSGSVRQ